MTIKPSDISHPSDIAKLFKDFPGHIYWRDCNGTFLGCNLKQAQSCGFETVEELIGKNDIELIGPEEAAEIKKERSRGS